MCRLKEEELYKLIKGGETLTVELKVASPKPIELAERFCGMANSKGGIIIIGVEDLSLTIVGVPETRIALTLDVVLRAARTIRPPLVLDPPEPEIYTLDEKQIVVVRIPPSSGPIYQSSGVCWIRHGTHTMPLSVSEILELAYDRSLLDWELQIAVKATLKDIDWGKVNEYLNQRSTSICHGSRFEDIEDVFVGMNCASVTDDGKILPTNAGILFFGINPQMYILQSEIAIVVFGEKLGVNGHIARKIINGTLQELIDETVAFLSKYIAAGGLAEPSRSANLLKYPMEVLREAIVNAVVHRDYSRRGESIRVFCYPDRIEIHNPGLLLPGITCEQMERGEVKSRLRNVVLANLLRDVPGYIERIGSGIKLMLRETERKGLSTPQFRMIDEFIVTLRNTTDTGFIHEDNGTWARKETQGKTFNANLWSALPSLQEDEKELETSKHDALLEQRSRMMKGMHRVQASGTITNREYRTVTGTSERTAFRDLELLVERGALRRIGKNRGRQYRLP